jgi:L-rhamnose mutarotase
MYSIGLAMTLRPGCYAEYKQAHDDLWPDIAKSMTDNNIDMAIYRFDEHLIIHATAPSEADWEKSRQVPILEDWYEYMAKLLETDDQGEIIFEELEEAFAFGQFKAN